MTIRFLGTGTSQGVPVIACDCRVCTSVDPRDKRLRSSVLVTENGKNIVIDTGPDFRYQMLRENIKHLEAVLYTHAHKDHIAGLDDIRAFNYFQGVAIDVYADQRVQDELKREFYYMFNEHKYPGIPRINLHDVNQETIYLHDIAIEPIEVMHHELPIKGYRFGDFTYLTDVKTVSPLAIDKIKGTKILVINALQREPHISHFNLEEALAFAHTIGAEQTYLTHISHRLGRYQEVSQELPDGVYLAYDGLMLTL
ncbi:MBL fold metallo-hydrolase [Olivibacter ginsenosidimutans]|uniref:MBL fold metallo-hydrolase n=1 Tax=Olivibacter ginsenosidimutans TaxID=1176537 RepID=A0ABP9BBL6_9SPHI